jgi:FMN-dependent NADH-azoreductase
MSKVLLIESSIFGEHGKSRALAQEFLAGYPHSSLVERRLTPALMPHLDGETFAAFRVSEVERTEAQKQSIALSDTLIAELEGADAIVLAVPMYNFSIPSTLKAWLDHVVRAGRTFRYTASGPEGLLKGKKAFVLTARGGHYSDGAPAQPLDFQEPYLRSILGFIGLTDVTFVHLEGLARGPDEAAKGLERARAAVKAIVRERAAA